MNIFALSKCPVESAQQMLDKHVVKMPTETCQMLHTNMLFTLFKGIYGFEPSLRELKIFHEQTKSNLMKPAMLNHPSTIWARESQDNFQWLLDHCEALCNEYTLRYDKTHSVENTLKENYDTFMQVKTCLPSIGLTPFAIAISPHMKCRKHNDFHTSNTVDKYRLYYLEDKWKFASWKYGSPSWWPNDHIAKKNQEWNDWLESENKRIRRANECLNI